MERMSSAGSSRGDAVVDSAPESEFVLNTLPMRRRGERLNPWPDDTRNDAAMTVEVATESFMFERMMERVCAMFFGSFASKEELQN